MRLALALYFYSRACADRRSELQHSIGLEEEHERISSMAWPVTVEDARIIDEIKDLINTEASDINFTWENRTDGHFVREWVWNFVKKTDRNTHDSLINHMLHHHGLAPYVASQHGAAFMEYFPLPKGQVDPEDVRDFVGKLHFFDKVGSVVALMRQLTLEGLRNLHSYDHSWSIDTIPPGHLQASLSKITYSFMESYGFGTSWVANAIRQHWGPSTRNLGKELNSTLMAPRSLVLSGATFKDGVIHVDTDLDSSMVLSGGGSHKGMHIYGAVEWTGDKRSNRMGAFTIPIGEKEWNMIEEFIDGDTIEWSEENKGKGLVDALQNIFSAYVYDASSLHREYMAENTPELWTYEEADFFKMHTRPVKPCLH
jgi:hypothetical protein